VNGRALALVSGRVRDGPRRLSPPLVLGLAAVALAATGAAVYTTAISRHAPYPAAHASLTVVVCLSFVGAGIVALRRPPYAHFGLLLAAVGLASLLGALHDANDPLPYTIGLVTANLAFAVLVHALLAYPGVGPASRRTRLLIVVGYLNVLVLQAVAILFDPLTRWQSDHPRNLALVDSHEALSTGLEELEAAIAAFVAVCAVIVLSRRARSATPAARTQLTPVLVGGMAALLLFSAGLVLAPISSDAAVVGIGLGLLAAVALPVGFLAIMLQGRLSRSAVGELLLELRERGRPPGLRDALRRALHDPSLEVARLRPGDGGYVDRSGNAIELPEPGTAQVSTPILYDGEPVGALVHDRSLQLRPELLDAVNAAAGFALANERALGTLQRVEERNRALVDALPDLMIRVSRDGTYLDVRVEDQAELVMPPHELIGQNVRDVLEPDLADRVFACIEKALETGRMSSIEYEIEIAGVPRWKESRMVPSGDDEVVTIVRDFTVQRRAQAQQRRLAEEQAALRRVATLVAGDAAPEQVFQKVTEEVSRLLGIREAVLERFEDDDTAVIVGRYGERAEGGFELGTVIPVEEGFAAWQVRRTGAPAHVDSYDHLPGQLARRVRELGFRSTVAAPINVAGDAWGALIAASTVNESLPPDTEQRLQGFAELVGLAVASAQARDELAASRLRIVEASDAERRRIERNLHDGAQQRLLALSVGLRLVQSKVHDSPREADELLGIAVEELGAALTELRELAQGIHPAVLTDRGLEAALEVLVARTPLPVVLDIRLHEPLPEPVEAAAYYVVSEALANVVKHAGASSARVRVDHAADVLTVEIDDDGLGGADVKAGGSGLYGLRDRIEALEGSLRIGSPRGGGTRVSALLPVRVAERERAGAGAVG
jgi:signal transduction histidine kinase